MALSKSVSKQEVSNLACIARILLGPCTDTLRDVLTNRITHSFVKDSIAHFCEGSPQKNQLYLCLHHLMCVYGGNYSDFDIPILYFFLQSIYNIHFPQPNLGPSSSEETIRLSRNIKCIYRMHKKYKKFQYDVLKDSAFEKDWEKLFRTVKELEKYIGSATANQDAMKQIKNGSMDPDVEHLFIENLVYGIPPVSHFWTKPGSKKEAQVHASRRIEAYLESFGERSLDLEKALGLPESFWEVFQTEFIQRTSTAEGDGRSNTKRKFSQIVVVEDTGAKDVQMTRSQSITSADLKKLFNTFKVEYPDDPHSESFIHQILQDGMLKKLVTAIKSLSKEVVLTKNFNEIRYAMPPVGACVFEVDVVFDGDQFSAVRKDSSSNDFFNVNEDYLTRVILIKSKSLPVVDAKLVVYKKYKHVINRRKIILQHEYEEFDDVAKCIAYQTISSFCTFVESVINAFTMDLHTEFSDYHIEALTFEKIKRLCEEVFKRIEDETVEIFDSKRDWSRCVADEIGRIMRRKGEPVCSDAWVEIQNICQKTVKDLNGILIELEEFQTCVLPVDQNKQIEEWLKRDVIIDKSVLKMHPSIIEYITGYIDRDDKKQVVKVYLHGDDKKAENSFKDCCKISADTYFEFVNVEKSRGEKKEVDELQQRERKAPAVDNSTRKQLKQIIQEYGDKIYARHSNVVGIRIGKARRVGDTIQEHPCLVLYCLDKYLIPFGEKPLPDAIAGWPCDIREDFVRFGICPNRCFASKQNHPDPGCSIGIPLDDSSGSVGFLIESKDPLNTFEFGFLTASHVAVKSFEQLYHDGKLLSMHSLRHYNHFIVHPSWIDNERIDHEVGKVVESFCGNYGLNMIGLDFAVIASSHCRNGAGKETLTVATEEDLDFEANMVVTKTGRTTGTTYGYLKDNCLTVKVNRSFLSRGYFAFFNCYAIENNTDIQPFFLEGDSGSGVYVMENGKPSKPLGIAFAYLDSQTAVCNIAMIVDKLDLQIVRYLENKENLKTFEELKIPDEEKKGKLQEPMELS